MLGTIVKFATGFCPWASITKNNPAINTTSFIFKGKVSGLLLKLLLVQGFEGFGMNEEATKGLMLP